MLPRAPRPLLHLPRARLPLSSSSSSSHSHETRRPIADLRPFRSGDRVLLQSTEHGTATPILTRPLRAGGRVETHRGVVLHDDILGRRARQVVRAVPRRRRRSDDDSGHDPEGGGGGGGGGGGAGFRVLEVSLADYVRRTRRLVTPVYPDDAAVIVGIMDLHPGEEERGNEEEEEEEERPRLEILEAGTGHGALTLYLSRAVHAANGPAPPQRRDEEDREGDEEALRAWKARRRAIVHSVDVSAKYSAHASDVVRGFRRGMYHGNVDFHVDDVGAWTAAALDARGGVPFLSHAFLDLPDADARLEAVAAALRTDGTLIVFNPSVTQIAECTLAIQRARLPLAMDRVLELGVNGGSAGREWAVRPVRPRSVLKAREARRQQQQRQEEGDADKDEEAMSSADGEGFLENGGASLTRDEGQDVVSGHSGERSALSDDSVDEDDWSMICRPKVGDRVVGGGFLGVWKKLRDNSVE